MINNLEHLVKEYGFGNIHQLKKAIYNSVRCNAHLSFNDEGIYIESFDKELDKGTKRYSFKWREFDQEDFDNAIQATEVESVLIREGRWK